MNALYGSWMRLLTLGAMPRLALAAGVIVLLWAGFFWATSPVGPG